MNLVKPFDLTGVNFQDDITEATESRELAKRTAFYRMQMDILKKTAVPYQIEEGPEDHRPLMLEPNKEADLNSWSAKEDLDNEHFPHQIVLAIRLTKPAFNRKYKFIPEFQSFHTGNDRLYLQVSS